MKGRIFWFLLKKKLRGKVEKRKERIRQNRSVLRILSLRIRYILTFKITRDMRCLLYNKPRKA